MTEVRSVSTPVDSARNVCARLHQAYRDQRLYPPGHPTVQNTMARVGAVVTSHLDTHGPLTLVVTETSLVYEGEEVYIHPEDRDNLAFLMFRDGIRGLTLDSGLDGSELEVLVKCLAGADEMVDTDHDLSTALWEHDLSHVHLEVVDPFLEGEGVSGETFEDLRDTVLQRLTELSSVDKAEAEAMGAPEGEHGATGSSLERQEPQDLGEEDLALTEDEVARGEWLASNPTDPLEDFVVVLLELAAYPAGVLGGEEAILNALAMVLARYLDDLDKGNVSRVLGQLQVFESQGLVSPGTVERVFANAASAEHLTRMLAAAAAASPETLQGVEQFLAQVRGSIYPALLETLVTSEDKVVRKTVLDLLRMEGGTPTQHLWPLMKDSRWYVVRNAVQLATASGDPAVVNHLEPLVHHADERVRREVIRSLGTLGDHKSVVLLSRAIQDEDSAVRILAVRALARLGSASHFVAVQSRVESRDFETRSGEEIEAFLSAYGALGGEATVEALNKMWKRKMFGTRSMAIRTAAVTALGAVGGPVAQKALSEAIKCNEPPLQRAAAKAIGETQTRIKGAGS